MYKDVWKRFGAKILIVVCSILLLGGVAIVAPRLRAAASNVDKVPLDLTKLKEEDVNKIKVVDEQGNETDVEYIGQGQNAYPKYLKINDNIYSVGRSDSEEGACVVTPNSTSDDYCNAALNYDTDKVSIRLSGNNRKPGILSGTCPYVFQYAIHRKSIPASDLNFTITKGDTYKLLDEDQKNDTSILVTKRNNPALSVGQTGCTFQVKVGANVTLDDGTRGSSDTYDILGMDGNVFQPTPASNNGQQSFYIKTRNYEPDTSNGKDEKSRYFLKSVRVVYYIDTSKILLDGKAWTVWNGTGLNERFLPSVTVKDGSGNALIAGSDYTVSEAAEVSDKENYYTFKIKGISNECYGLVESREYTETAQEAYFRLVEKKSDGTYVEKPVISYKEGTNGSRGTYLITDMDNETKSNYEVQVQTTLDDGTIGFVTAADSWDDIDKVLVNGQYGEIDGKPGATAGYVRQRIRIGKQEGDIYYNVVRSFEGTGSEQNYNPHLQIDAVGQNCEYDGSTSFKLEPKIYFTDYEGDTKYELKKGTDFNVTYSLDTNDDGTVDETNSDCKNAGRVIMTITGVESAGYKGSLAGRKMFTNLENLTYVINPRDYGNEQYEVRLGSEAADSYVYPQGTDRETIEKAAMLCRKGGSVEKEIWKDLSGNYTASFWYNDTILKSGENFVAGREYEVRFTFRNNYKGTLSCKFTIQRYEWENVNVEVADQCETDSGSAITGAHVYNGQLHEPDVRLYIVDDVSGNEVDVPETAYSIEGYDRNINANEGKTNEEKAIVSIKLVGHENEPDKGIRSTPFDIQKRPVGRENLSFSQKDGFRKENGAWIHDYAGSEVVQDLTELGVSYKVSAADENETTAILMKTTDFTVAPGLYDDKGNTLAWANIGRGTLCYYKVTFADASNYKVGDGKGLKGDANTLLVGPFQFEPRVLTKPPVTIKQENDHIDYPDDYPVNGTDEEKAAFAQSQVVTYLSTAGNLTVKDGDVLLTYNTDYQIELVMNKISDNGTIEFKISGKNCYSGTSTLYKINVGLPITGTKVRERALTSQSGIAEVDFVDGVAELKNEYPEPEAGSDDPDRYGINFMSRGDNQQDILKTYLYANNDKDQRLYLNEKYTASFGDIKIIPPEKETDKVFAYLTIKGINEYYGEATLKFAIGKIDMRNREISVTVREPKQYVYQWDGVSIPVKVDVYDKGPKSVANPDAVGVELTEGVHYRIEYDSNSFNDRTIAPDQARTHNFYVRGIGRYKELVGGTFHYTILPRPISLGRTVTGSAIEIDYENDIYPAREFKFVEGKELKHSYEYIPSGVKPIVELEYTHLVKIGESKTKTEILKQNEYVFQTRVDNGDRVTVSDTEDENHARMLFSPKTGNVNFTGSFYQYFNITSVKMDDDKTKSNCFIRLTDEVYDFAAKDIKPGNADKDGHNQDTKQLIVGQYIQDGTEVPDNVQKDDIHRDDKRTWIEIDPNEYTVKYSGNYYVSSGYTGTNENEITQIEIKGKYDGKNSSQNIGNYEGTMTKEFIIRGDLSKSDVSRTVITDNVIPYSSIQSGSTETSGMTVGFYQKKRQADGTGSATEEEYRALKWTGDYDEGDYDVFIKGKNIIGAADENWTVGVYEKSDITGIRGAGDYFNPAGHLPTDIVIQGNLAGKETTVTKKNSLNEEIVIEIPEDKTASDLNLQDFITVTCGGRILKYNVDYLFYDGQTDGEVKPNMNPGEGKQITIKPTKDAAVLPGKGEGSGYLTGSKIIKYRVQQKLSAYYVTGIERGQEIQYNHGNDVLDLRDIEVRVSQGGKKLEKDIDYTIGFKNNDGKSVGQHAIIISPIGDYSGQPYEIPFRIIRYNLQGLEVGKDILINYEPTATYTGSDVFPKIAYVRVDSVTVSGSGIQEKVDIYGKDDVKPGDDSREIAYELRPVEGQDNINFQNRTEVECILAGVGNYEGEVRLKYSILQKNIEDKSDGENFDVDFYTDKQEYEYRNGESIKPEPRGEYNGIVFTGQVDNGSGTFDRKVPFTFTYPKDTINVGTKTITITGNGNFTGVRTLDYNITQLDLANTELKFADAELIYDRHEQHPSFTLSYGGKQIVTYDKTNGVKSDYINNVKVTFENATNATKPEHLASVILSFDEKDKTNSNYTGTKTAQFTIQPASLDNHVTFMYHPKGEAGNMELKSNLKLPWTGEPVKMEFPVQEPDFNDTDLKEGEAGALYDFAGKANNGDFLKWAKNEDAQPGHGDYTLDFKYVEPDSDDTDVKEGYGDAPNCTFAGKVKVTITGINNYKDSASFWYYIGEDISADGSAKLQTDKTIYNAKKQPPTVIVSGISRSKYNVERYRGEVKNENYIKSDKEITDAATYYIRIEGNPSKGTYASKPITLTYIIQPRPISNSVVIDGFKKEYNYTGLAICPVGISVTDYIDRTKYKLTENEDYSLTYTNNINVGTATINVNGEGNFKGTAAARFAITSSMISGGSNGTPGGSVSNGSGQISGAVAVAPDDVRVTLDAGNAMYYTGKQLTPAVTINNMTQNTDYTVTYSNNIEVGTGVITITGIGNNTGTITKNFRIVAKLSDCKVTNIPDQQYTGSAVEPLITVTCGNSILTKDKDYTVSFVDNVEIGTATAMIRAAGNSNYIGSLEAKFNIGNNVGGFIVSGYAPTYPYTGSAITPAVTVESGSTRLQQGTDYTVSYENNVDAGSASIIVKGAGKYTGTQTVNFIIEPRSIQVCDTTEVEDKTYTGDAYTPSIIVRDNGKELRNGTDYTLTYSDNVNPGLATITIQGLSNNYTGTKKITFRIGGVAVSGLQVSAVNATSIKLKWQQQGYADGYQVCNSKSKVVKTVNGGNDSTTVAGLKPGKTYKYKVRSYTTNSQGERSYSAASAVVTATTKLKTPAVTLKRNGTGRMRIKWTKSTNADGYEIFYKNTKSAKYRRIKKVDDVNTRICNVRGIKSGKKCYVRVRAYKKTGSTTLRSAMSKTKTIKVK